ncbi:hypothetical protein IFM89_005405 [Coptis chinensis]|uniref:RCC1-like domain-containing protein n=1 Tax=Coptis chinensis TaxID=261450 RepID=A0A835IU03_9MAGN|nr:hypothetical protein IFM89_005405 [Coptis chinensis]
MEEKERQEEEKNSINNKVWSWGAGTEGQLGTTKLQDENHPQLIHYLSFTPKHISYLACGGAHVIALSREDGKVLSWGRGTSGQLGHGDMKNCLYPFPVKCLESFVVSYVSAGWNHSGFVSNTGRVLTCGDGTFGQLGHGDFQSQCLPIEVMYFRSRHVEQITCGMRHTLVLLKGNSGDALYGFGSGKRGQLGTSMDMITKSLNLPQVIFGFQQVNIARIIANGDQSAALTVDGHLYTWGKGFHGISDACLPLLPSSALKFTKVALGWNHALLLTDCGTVFMLGGNHHGMLSSPQKLRLKTCSSNQSTGCQGSEDDCRLSILEKVSGLDGIKAVDIAAGAEHSALVTGKTALLTIIVLLQRKLIPSSELLFLLLQKMER